MVSSEIPVWANFCRFSKYYYFVTWEELRILCRYLAWIHYQSSVFNNRIPLYSERMVQTTKQVSSHWLFWKLKSSKILVVIILQKKDFWLLKCLPRAILCLPSCYDKHQGRKNQLLTEEKLCHTHLLKVSLPGSKQNPAKALEKLCCFTSGLNLAPNLWLRLSKVAKETEKQGQHKVTMMERK